MNEYDLDIVEKPELVIKLNKLKEKYDLIIGRDFEIREYELYHTSYVKFTINTWQKVKSFVNEMEMFLPKRKDRPNKVILSYRFNEVEDREIIYSPDTKFKWVYINKKNETYFKTKKQLIESVF